MAVRGLMHHQTAADGVRIGHYHVRPEVFGVERQGGLVLIQEIFGVTDHIKEQCDLYASEGFEVLSPALFDRMEPDFAVGYEPEEIARARTLAGRADWDHVAMDVAASVAILEERGPVFITGYCFGGSVSWVAACRVPGIAAASGYYGRLIVDFIDEVPHCPTILHFGETDPTIPMDDVAKIQARHPQVPVHVYPAGHGFNSDRRADYSESCARLARERTLDHFRAHL